MAPCILRQTTILKAKSSSSVQRDSFGFGFFGSIQLFNTFIIKNYDLLGIKDEHEDPTKKIRYFKNKLAKLTALLGKIDDESDDETDFLSEFPIQSEEQLESLEERIKDNVLLQHELVYFH